MSQHQQELVLVTGASGFVGSHVVKALLNRGLRVRATVRSVKNAAKCEPVRALDPDGRLLELVEADLLSDGCWGRAMNGVTLVCHVASPVNLFRDPEIVKTACSGTMRVLSAAHRARTVRKVVITSSITACNEGHTEKSDFDERDWSIVDDPKMNDYVKSKTLAEKAAWDYVKSLPAGSLELCTLLPSFVYGPVLTNDCTSSLEVVARARGVHVTKGKAQIVRGLLERRIPALARYQMPTVDVRDVAEAHVTALLSDATNGQRYILCAQSTWLVDIAEMLKERFQQYGYRLPTTTLPKRIVKLGRLFDVRVKEVVSRVGRPVRYDTTKAQTDLGLTTWRPIHEALWATGDTMIERGLVKQTNKWKQSH